MRTDSFILFQLRATTKDTNWLNYQNSIRSCDIMLQAGENRNKSAVRVRKDGVDDSGR